MSTVARVYGNAESAEQARMALLDGGFSREQVSLESRDDEAGPVQGNFVIADTGEAREPAVQRGTLVLWVTTDTDDQERRATDILDGIRGGDAGQSLEGRH